MFEIVSGKLVHFHICCQDSGLDLLLSRARTFPWHNVDITTYKMVSDYVSAHYPANMVLCLPEEPRAQILHVLKAASGMLAQHGTIAHKARHCSSSCLHDDGKRIILDGLPSRIGVTQLDGNGFTILIFLSYR